MATTVLLAVSDNEGYAPDQINTSITLQDMLEGIQDAINTYGADAVVVVSNGQRYGAGFGSLVAFGGHDVVISAANPDDESDEDYSGLNL